MKIRILNHSCYIWKKDDAEQEKIQFPVEVKATMQFIGQDSVFKVKGSELHKAGADKQCFRSSTEYPFQPDNVMVMS